MCEDKGYKDKYTHVTLAEEDDKPEDGEEVELRRCESSPRTTRKSIIGKEIKEGRVVEQGKDFEGISKSFFEKPKDTYRRRGEGRGMMGSAGEEKQSLLGGWSMGKGWKLRARLGIVLAGIRSKICQKEGA